MGGSLKLSSVQFCLELALHFVMQLLSTRTLRWLVGRTLRIFCTLNLPEAHLSREVDGGKYQRTEL